MASPADASTPPDDGVGTVVGVGASPHTRKNNELLCISFNQDCSCLSAGTSEGYRIYNCEPFQKCYGKSDGGIGVVEMLFSTSLVALVGAGEQPGFSPRQLTLWNTRTMTNICELNFVSSVLAIRLNKKRLVAVMETKIHIFDLSNLKILQTIDTAPNPKGLVALSPNDENCMLAYPNSNVSGEVMVYDALNLQAVTIVQAHKTPLAQLCFGWEGDVLATCSDKGTVIRVFSVPNGMKTHTLRRGTYPTTIYSMAFSCDASMLCVSSATGTVHIFKLDQQQNESLVSGVTNYLPEVISDMWDSGRDFAFVKLHCQGVKTRCAINRTMTQVMVATLDGYFYQYTLDPVNGGECRLEKENSLLESESDQIEARFV
eukprot:GFYU01002794.1.p1 GENE.GFYU01002794.1~~GFYU01002794.1.p1  ORF type:complete len:373 (+),score=56.93 GFYU01002794.1:221-1339(+)